MALILPGKVGHKMFVKPRPVEVETFESVLERGSHILATNILFLVPLFTEYKVSDRIYRWRER